MRAERWVPTELELDSSAVTVVVYPPDTAQVTTPTFRRGQLVLARIAPSTVGHHRWEAHAEDGTVVSTGMFDAVPYAGTNPLYAAGPVRARTGSRVLEHADGSPFLWLADAWWLGLTDRIGDDDLCWLIDRRVQQGFSSAQVVAGFIPEVEAFDERGILDGCFPWDHGFSRPNERWWAAAERRLRAIVDAGLVPFVYGAWGYHMGAVGLECMAKHWREIVARWSAFPVAFVVAGEASLPWYTVLGTPDAERTSKHLAEQWAEVVRRVRGWDGHGRLISVHPSPGNGSFASRDVFADPTLFDVDSLQTGHQGARSAAKTRATVVLERREIDKPVIVAEACWEGILGSSWHDVQRLAFWLSMLSGAAGFGYGAEGLFSFTEDIWDGGCGAWGEATWRQAAEWPGASHIGLGRKLLERYPWDLFEPRPDWVEPHASDDDPLAPVAAGTEDVRFFYFPSYAHTGSMRLLKRVVLTDLGEAPWRAVFVNPRTGRELREWTLAPQNGRVELTNPPRHTALPTMDDWLLILERHSP